MVQSKLEKKAREVLDTLEETLVSKYGEDMQEFFPWSKNNQGTNLQRGTYTRSHHLLGMNEDIDMDLEALLARVRPEDQYTKLLVEGLDLLNEGGDTNTEVAPKAMLIHTGDSDASMSGISTTSKSTVGSVHWNLDVEDKERTAETMKQTEQTKIETHMGKI